MRERTEAVFREVFELPDAQNIDKVSPDNTERWDSLGHVTLVAALESEFAVEFSLAESLELTSMDAAIRLLRGKLPSAADE